MSINDAAENLLAQINVYKTWEAGAGLTCGEVDAFARLHLAAGDHDAAYAWIESHSADEEGEAHHGVDTDEAINEYLISGYNHEVRPCDDPVNNHADPRIEGPDCCKVCGEAVHFYGSDPEWMHNNDWRNG